MWDGWSKTVAASILGAGHASEAAAATPSETDASSTSPSRAPSALLPRALTARVLRRPALAVAGLALAAAAGLLFIADRSDADAPPSPLAAPKPAPPKPAWLPIVRPIRLFALEAPELVKGTANYDAMRPAGGDGREDDLSFGAAARADAPFMRLSVYRAGGEATEPAAFFIDLTRHAAAAGVAVTKIVAGEPMPTKFGEMETADARLAAAGGERSCLAFRRAVKGEPVRLSGWYCAPVGSFAGRAGLACLLDRLALLSAGEDHGLRDSFVAAERRRAGCGKAPVVAAALDAQGPASKPPRLRGVKGR